MKVKVCGMKEPGNIKELWKLPVNYMGLIFYAKSPRFAEKIDPKDMEVMPSYIERVGVFVNAEKEYIVRMIERYKLDLVQLHGTESVTFCKEINNIIPVMKAFNVSETSDFKQAEPYKDACRYFLFDTKTPHHGGSGIKFDWNILNAYKMDVPFFLSGGISPDDVEDVLKINHPMLYGIDLNSRFETEPGIKNIESLKQFIKHIRNEQN